MRRYPVHTIQRRIELFSYLRRADNACGHPDHQENHERNQAHRHQPDKYKRCQEPITHFPELFVFEVDARFPAVIDERNKQHDPGENAENLDPVT